MTNFISLVTIWGFSTNFRPHAQEQVPSEPVFRTPKTIELSKQAIDLRYSLLPYNYHFFENNTKGLPLMRPLFFEDSRIEIDTVSSTYLWGNDFLISQLQNQIKNYKKFIFKY